MKETLINVYYYVRFMLHKAKQKFTSRLRTLRYQLFHKTTREIEISKCGLCNRQWNTTILKDEEGLPIYFGDPINPFCLKCAQSRYKGAKAMRKFFEKFPPKQWEQTEANLKQVIEDFEKLFERKKEEH